MDREVGVAMRNDKQLGWKDFNFYKYLKTITIISNTLLLIFILIFSTTILQAEVTELPVYRFWSEQYLHHFYTISEDEKDYVTSIWPDIWNYEKIAFYAYPNPISGTLPVYRFWSDVYKGHFYTISEIEKDYVIATWPDVWKFEKIAFYAYPDQVPGTLPVYRFWSDIFFGHFYTIFGDEKNYVTSTWPDVWNYEKVGFYAYPTALPEALDVWHLKLEYTEPFIRGITYGNGVFVAVGNTILTSSNGTSWTIRNQEFDSGLEAVNYINGIFVAVGSLGTILTSNDGANWNNRNSDTSYQLRDVTYGNGTYVAVGGENEEPYSIILTSTDGVNWVYRNSGIPHRLNSVTFGNGIFVAVGESGTILTSVDGILWFEQSSEISQGEIKCIRFYNGVYIAGGGNGIVITSFNGIDWSIQSSGYPTYDITYGNGNIVITGGSSLLTSTDGLTWTVIENAHILNGPIAYGNGLFVSFRFEGTRHTSSSYFLASSGLVNWSETFLGTNYYFLHPEYFYGITHKNNTLVVVGENIISSLDGNTWTITSVDTQSIMKSVTSGKGYFVAVGNNTVIKSIDGLIWTKKELDISYNLNAITYADGIFVAVGEDSIIITSPDGDTWTLRNSGPSNSLNGITYGNGQFIAVGYGGIMLTSPNGISWTSRNSGTSASLNGINYVNNLFIAVGTNTTIITSTNGFNWAIQDSGLFPYDNHLYGVAFEKGNYVLCGRHITGYGGIILTSEDGINWQKRSSVGGYAITSANDTFFTVIGNYIYQSDPLE
jgi:hypothetical protein